MFSFTRNRNAVLVLLIIIAILAIILFQAGILQPLQDFALGAFQPIFGGAMGVGESARNVTTGLSDVNTLRNKVGILNIRLPRERVRVAPGITKKK